MRGRRGEKSKKEGATMTQQFFNFTITTTTAPARGRAAKRPLPTMPQPDRPTAAAIPAHADTMPIRGDEYRGRLAVGQWVECMLYGGKAGYIAEIRGEQQPETIRRLGGGAMVMGGNCDLLIAFETGGAPHVVPECIVRGVQWRIGGMLTADERAEIDADGVTEQARREAERAAKLAADTAERLAAPARFPHLETAAQHKARTGKDVHSHKLAISNVRRDLAKNFPGVKFSVTMRDYDCIDVSWCDGPRAEAVQAVVARYEDHVTDETGDCRDYSPTVFTGLFGGVKYTFATRRASEATEQITRAWAAEQLAHGCSWGSWNAPEIARKLLAGCDIPAGRTAVAVRARGGVSACAGNDPAGMYELVCE
jgi:hypothetical protein